MSTTRQLSSFAARERYTTTRFALQAAGLAPNTKRGGPHRKKRERRPLQGVLLFQDGSTHHWIPAPDLDLIVTLDDVSGAILFGDFVAQEGAASIFLGLGETIAKKGLFRASYRSGHLTDDERRNSSRATDRSIDLRSHFDKHDLKERAR